MAADLLVSTGRLSSHMKLMSVENFCRTMWGIRAFNEAVEKIQMEDAPELTERELAESDKDLNGDRGMYQRRGLRIVHQVAGWLKENYDSEFGEILEGRESFPFVESGVMRSMVSLHRYNTEDEYPIPEKLARAYYYFGKVSTTGRTHCPSKKRGAIAALCSLLWGINTWKKYVKQIEEKLDEEDESLLPEFNELALGIAKSKGYEKGGIRRNLAVELVESAVRKIDEMDPQLAEILKWNVLGESEGVEEEEQKGEKRPVHEPEDEEEKDRGGKGGKDEDEGD